MPTSIDRDQVRALVETGARLVEVLPAVEYEEEHLRGALSIPLKQLDTSTVGALDRGLPVIVYCWDYL